MERLMTSLKAISTLPRKSKLLLLLLIIILSAAPVSGAGSFRVAVTGESDDYVSLLETVLSSIGIAGSDEALTLREERREIESERTLYARMTEESRSETWSGTKETETEVPSSLTVEIVSIDLSPYSEFLRSGDEDAYLYLRTLDSLDGIFYVKSESDGDSERIDVLFNGRTIHSGWYNSALYSSEEDVLFSLLSSLLLPSGYSLYRITLTPENAALLVDGSVLENEGGYVILENGTHTFSLSSYGYRDAVYSVTLDGRKKEIALSLESDESMVLSVSTYPFDADIYLNGIRQSSRRIEGVYTPYVITLESEGFSQYTYQERRKDGRITLYMEPEWTEGNDLVTEKKGAFYSSLFYTLLSFGGYTASAAVSTYYSAVYGSAMEVVFTGGMIVSLVNLLSTAVDYYNTARLGL